MANRKTAVVGYPLHFASGVLRHAANEPETQHSLGRRYREFEKIRPGLREVDEGALVGREARLQDRVEYWPVESGGPAGDENAVVARGLHEPFNQFDRRRAKPGEARDHFLVLTGLSKLRDCRSVELTAVFQFVDEGDCMAVVAGRCGLTQHLVGHRGENALDRSLPVRRDDDETTVQ